MAFVDRARSALMFALVVAAAQAGCLLVIWLLSLLPAVVPTRRRAGTAPLIQMAMFGLLLAVPVFMHDGPIGRRWPCVASRQVTIVISIIGLAAGFVIGGLLAENGYVASWTLASRVGAVAGSFAALTLLNLFASGSSA